MKKGVKGLKIAGIVLAAPVALFIIWEIFCVVVNYISGCFKTDSVLNDLSNSSAIDVLDYDTFVGNTSGTGNHTEVRSTILVNCSAPADLEYWLGGADENTFIFPLLNKSSDEINDRWGRDLKIPSDVSECYVVEVFNDVPFSDSILGH